MVTIRYTNIYFLREKVRIIIFGFFVFNSEKLTDVLLENMKKFLKKHSAVFHDWMQSELVLAKFQMAKTRVPRTCISSFSHKDI